MSNSTQNDEIEVDGETYTKWDTQNDEIKQMERAINEGFAESEKFLKGMKTPFDKSSTQNNDPIINGTWGIYQRPQHWMEKVWITRIVFKLYHRVRNWIITL